MSPQFAFILFGLNAIACGWLFRYIVRARRPGLSAWEIFRAGPDLFLRPEDYMAKGKISVPWKALGWYALVWLGMVALI